MFNGLPKRARIFDFGANRKILKEDSTIGVCPRCRGRQAMTRQAWYRSSRPQCRACGEYLVPSERAQKRHLLSTKATPIAVRKCELCGAILRSGNTATVCAPCERKNGPNLAATLKAIRQALRARPAHA